MKIFITGSTGFVGGEVLINLSKREDVSKIFCLIRAADEADAWSRLEHVFDIHDDHFDRGKVVPVIGNLFDENLTESLSANKSLKHIDVIIHSAANTSFSRIYDDQVEKANIGGLQKILLWAKHLPDLVTFLYVGTATICGKDIKNRVVLEQESPDMKSTHLVKYTYTKMLGEIILEQYLPKEKILIARPSIIMGDSRPIIPRSPVVLWALATFNLLRLIPMNPHAHLDIIPVDYAAKAIVELLFTQNRKHRVYHISAGKASVTSPEMLTRVMALHYNHRPEFMFVNKSLLSQMKNWAKNRLDPESELNNYTDFLKYWETAFNDACNLRIILAGLIPYIEFIELGQIFDNSRLLQDTTLSNPVPAHFYIKNSIDYLEKIDVFAGAIDP